MILKLLLNTQMKWIIFIKILKNTIQIKNEKFLMLLMIADMLSNKSNNNWIIRGRKLKISLVFITQCCFAVPKKIRLNSTHYFMMKISNKRELQQTEFNHSSDFEFQNFMNFYKQCTAKHILF